MSDFDRVANAILSLGSPDCRRAFNNTQLCALNDYSGTLAA